MEFKKSVTGIPYIEFDENTRLAFGLKSGDRYKGLVFSGSVKGTIKDKRGKIIDQNEKVSFITDFELSDIKKTSKKVIHPVFTKTVLDNIRGVLKPFTKNGYILEKDISSIEKNFIE